MIKQVLVTTGATVTFVKLISYVLDEQFIREIQSLKYNQLVVQYGNSKSSKELVLSLLSNLKTIQSIKEFENGTIQTSLSINGGNVNVKCITFDSKFVEKYTEKSHLIISHAGTGSILDTLRCNKKLLVVINEDLLDNHQLDIAKAFEQVGVLYYHDESESEDRFTSYNNFLKLVQKVSNSEFKKLPKPKGELVEKILFCDL